METAAGRHEAAATLYERVLAEHPTHPRAAEAALRKGDALCAAGRQEAAVEAYSMVLDQREWRGEAWAEATFKIGLAFLDAGETGKAQGFFERTYLAFGGYRDWADRAILESGKLLESLGEAESARRTYEFFLSRPGADESGLYDEIRSRARALPTAGNA
jgi:tetratricopeptide (TPR) repeat protein